jgi:pimeloyl-ACP methyl ester carboxylesterase
MTEASVFFAAPDMHIAASRWDTGPSSHGAVVFLHGGGQTRHSWAKSARRVAQSGWTALALDARGHGDSDWAHDGVYSMDALVSDLVSVVATLPSPPVLVGASMGGVTALTAVGEKALKARALVLVDIAIRAEPDGVQRINDFMTSAPHGFASLQEVAEAINAYLPERRRSGNLDGLRKNVRQRADGRWYWHWDPAIMTFDISRAESRSRLRDAASQIDIPTLLIRGSSSDVLIENGVLELQQTIPHAVVEEVAAGHMITGDDNDVFASSLVRFISDVRIPVD